MDEHTYIIGCAVRTTQRISKLPAIPTQGWLQQCASSLVFVSDHAAVGSMVCAITPDSNRLQVLSAGAELSPDAGAGRQHNQLRISIQDRCERIARMDLRLPDQARVRGLLAPISAIDPDWEGSAFARAMTNAQFGSIILRLAPVGDPSNGMAVINIIGFDPRARPSDPRRTLTLLAAVHQQLSDRANDALSRIDNPRAWLTDRELGVLEQLIEGHSVRVIAENLDRSTHTIHDHVKNLHRKIGASSRGELIARALGHSSTKHPKADPILRPFPGEPLAELKPSQISARHLHHAADR